MNIYPDTATAKEFENRFKECAGLAYLQREDIDNQRTLNAIAALRADWLDRGFDPDAFVRQYARARTQVFLAARDEYYKNSRETQQQTQTWVDSLNENGLERPTSTPAELAATAGAGWCLGLS